MSRSSRMLATVGAVTAAVAVMLVTGAVAAKPAAPVIHEPFTAPQCSGRPGDRTTFQRLECAQQEVLRTDNQINTISATVFSQLPDDAARHRFVVAARAWLSYRNADCNSRSDVFEGGTEAPVKYTQCVVARDKTRLTDMRVFVSELTPSG